MKDRNVLITGGAGFIGSHLVRHFVKKYPDYRIFNLDKLTYAGNLENLKEIEDASNYTFLKADILDHDRIEEIFSTEKINSVIHLAAESHVDRSISDPLQFAQTNIMGTLNLLEVCRKFWTNDEGPFYHISTDEVYGSGDIGYFTERTPYDPHSPYSASKAGSDHFVRAYGTTYSLPYLISNCSNNYGPYQFPEKLIPLIINNIIQKKALPVYGKGENVRDWLYVQDHALAIDLIFHEGKSGETYNIGGESEVRNLDLVQVICDVTDNLLGNPVGSSRELITFVKDRPGHDQRYAMDITKIHNELGWSPQVNLEEGIKETVLWYMNNSEWLAHVTSGQYKNYYEKNYVNR